MSKTIGEKLSEELSYKRKNAAEILSEKEITIAFDFAAGYKEFIKRAKTEREFVELALEKAEKNGFKKFEYGKKYKSGDKIVYNNRNKALIMAVIGKENIKNGVNIVASHIDAPRIDLKPNPLYEDGFMAFFKTHYYGGIKKYQWPTVPLALHGVVIKKDLSAVNVCIGEDINDPVFYITDLLPHLASEQVTKPLGTAISAESLNVLVSSFPIVDEKATDKIKLNALKLLNEKYGIVEDDFLSAELSLVPALDPRDVGLDRSLIGAYAHDDRVCSYPAMEAILSETAPEKTGICVLADKEEIGSSGNTGLDTNFLYDFICELSESLGANKREVLSNSSCLSADVNVCFDPNFPEVYEKRNTAFINHGVVLTKYTGARGKSGTSDASAEFTAKIRALLEENNICWQTGELGKVDMGGGGTVAQYIAKLNIDVIDIGVAVLSMHAPYEVISKLDLYNMYLASKCFFESK